jgi:uncharacterized membrane-anchored protein
MTRILVAAGILLIAVGFFWPWLAKLPLGRLPGDLVIHRDGFRIYLPLTTSVLISAVLSLLFWLFRR